MPQLLLDLCQSRCICHRCRWLPGAESIRGSTGLGRAGPVSQCPSLHPCQEQGSQGDTGDPQSWASVISPGGRGTGTGWGQIRTRTAGQLRTEGSWSGRAGLWAAGDWLSYGISGTEADGPRVLTWGPGAWVGAGSCGQHSCGQYWAMHCTCCLCYTTESWSHL